MARSKLLGLPTAQRRFTAFMLVRYFDDDSETGEIAFTSLESYQVMAPNPDSAFAEAVDQLHLDLFEEGAKIASVFPLCVINGWPDPNAISGSAMISVMARYGFNPSPFMDGGWFEPGEEIEETAAIADALSDPEGDELQAAAVSSLKKTEGGEGEE